MNRFLRQNFRSPIYQHTCCFDKSPDKEKKMPPLSSLPPSRISGSTPLEIAVIATHTPFIQFFPIFLFKDHGTESNFLAFPAVFPARYFSRGAAHPITQANTDKAGKSFGLLRHFAHVRMDIMSSTPPGITIYHFTWPQHSDWSVEPKSALSFLNQVT